MIYIRRAWPLLLLQWQHCGQRIRQRARNHWWCLAIRNGVYGIGRRAWKFAACRVRVLIASIEDAAMAKIESCSKEWYPYRTMAKALLRNKDLSYEEIDVSPDAVCEQDEDRVLTAPVGDAGRHR